MHKLSKSVLTTALALTGAAVLWIGTTRAQAPAQTQPAGRASGAAAPGARGGDANAFPGGRGGPSPAPKKHLLVIGMTRGYHHGSTSDGVAMFWNLGKESGVYDTEIKTDMDLERLPSGKFATNQLVMACGALVYNILRFV